MSEDFDKVLYNRTLKNTKIIKPLTCIALSVGCNIGKITGFRDPIKLINLTWITFSILGLLGQYHFIWENRSKPLVVYTDALCTSFQTLISISKLLHFVWTQQNFQKLLRAAKTSEILHDFEIFKLNLFNKKQITQEIEEILQESWLDIIRQLNFYTISVFCIISWYYISCLVYNYYYTYVNPKEFDLYFPFQGSFPIWRDKGIQFPYFTILYFLSASETHMAGMGAISFAGVYIVTSIHALALLKILQKLVFHATTGNVLPEERVKYMLAWCRLHQRIYKYCDEINNLYYIQSAPLFLVSMVVLCLLIFQISVGLGNDLNLVIKMFLYFAAAGFEVAMFCVNGQRLTSESERIPVALYNSKWYDESAEFKFIIRMMLMRTNRSIAIQVGGFTTMSLVTLMAILRSSCSYFLLLREVNN